MKNMIHSHFLPYIKNSRIINYIATIMYFIIMMLFAFSSVILAMKVYYFETARKNYLYLFDYYEFTIDNHTKEVLAEKYESNSPSDIQINFGKAFSELLGNYQERYNADFISYHLKIVYSDDDIMIITYSKQDGYKNSCNEIEIPIKEGRFFEEDEDAVLLLRDFSLGKDKSISFVDQTGKYHILNVVGVSETDILPSTKLSLQSGLENFFTFQGRKGKKVYFLNPYSKLNLSDNRMDYSVLVRDDDEVLKNKLREKGTICYFKDIVSNAYHEIFVCVAAETLIIIILIIFSLINIFNEKKYGVWIFLAAIFAWIISSYLYKDALKIIWIDYKPIIIGLVSFGTYICTTLVKKIISNGSDSYRKDYLLKKDNV